MDCTISSKNELSFIIPVQGFFRILQVNLLGQNLNFIFLRRDEIPLFFFRVTRDILEGIFTLIASFQPYRDVLIVAIGPSSLHSCSFIKAHQQLILKVDTVVVVIIHFSV